ncbi:MAG: peptidoglycan editing factor PgeF [Burkholderiaceae bacterium]|nr:peptidoglycan editing factor PgeF [Burkholderiaceae bacterium]
MHFSKPSRRIARILNPDWLVPEWPAPSHVKALFTTRAGGVSAAPYDSLNLGDHVGDKSADVRANRQILQSAIGVRPVFLQQVHGTAVVSLTSQTPDGTVADACMTRQDGIACTIMVADCLPVLLTDLEGHAVAAAHAGWRGLAGGVLTQMHAQFMAIAGINTSLSAINIIAWLGPCIGPTAFEVGPEVKAAFAAVWPQSADMFKRIDPGQPVEGTPVKWLANLPGLARLQLQQLGVTNIYGNDGSLGWCTVNQPSRFFSHRRDAVILGGSGRLAACIWKV